MSALIHPIYHLLVDAERAWSDDNQQAEARALLVAIKLHASGFLPDAKVESGLILQRDLQERRI